MDSGFMLSCFSRMGRHLLMTIAGSVEADSGDAGDGCLQSAYKAKNRLPRIYVKMHAISRQRDCRTAEKPIFDGSIV